MKAQFGRLLLVLFVLIAASVACHALDVLVNQAGYERNGPKVFRAQRSTDFAGNGTFTVKTSGGVDTCTGTLVRKGGLWNKYYWEGDFSSLAIDGNYYIYANVNGETANSYVFNIGVGSLLNKTGKLTYQYLTAQRCGTAVSFQYIDRNGNNTTWSHNSCHTDDGYIYPSGPYIDSVGGWHDAGDYHKYGHAFAGNPVFDVLWLYDTNRSYFDSQDVNSNGIADILDEVIWQGQWLAKFVDANGHVMARTDQRRSGASWVKPENDTDRIPGNSDDRWIYIGDENTPQEPVVAAALARLHRVLASKGINTQNFASKALSIWNHRVALAEQQGGHNNLGSAMHQIFAGVDLYTIYGQQNCWNRAVLKVGEIADMINNNVSFYDNMDYAEGPGYDVGAIAWFARTYPNEQVSSTARTAIQSIMDHNINYLASPQIGLTRRNEGGNLQYFPANPSLGLNRLYGFLTWGAIECYKTIGNAAYLRFALDQYNWILGANYHYVCMMEAAGTPGSSRYVDKYHTRYDTFVTNGIEPGVVMNGHIRDASGLPWVYFGTGSASVQTNEGWLPNQAGYAMALANLTGVFSSTNESAYGSVVNLPGTVQAENYNNGGESIAYRDYSAGNSGGQYRSDNVDIEGCSEGGYNVGWIETGEWLDYLVNPGAGTYNILVRVACPGSGGSFHIEMNGKNVCNATAVPNTGGWQNWQTVTISNVYLNGGQQTLTFYVDNGGFNLNYIQVNAVAGTNHAAYVSDTIPSTMNAGQTYNCTITMQNDGTTTWTNGSGPTDYNFGPWDAPPGPNINWAPRTDVSGNIAPGQQCTFNLSITPPGGASPGLYQTTWGMVQETVQWFQNMVTKPITISGTDTTPPTFGGSINPSATDVVLPVITITAQDTGTGLNIGSSEFAYSLDNGTSYCTYIGRYVLHSKGTGSGGDNRYWYPDFYHPTSYTIANGDHLQYDIYILNTDGKGSVDLEGSFGNLRDSGIPDQNGLSGHANTNLYTYAYQKWYHRDFNLSSKAGQSITAFEMAHETDSGVSEFYVRNVIITNNGLVKVKAADSDAWTSVSDTVAPTSNGYSSLVGPEMLSSDPASPSSCTGSNGTTAQQTITATFTPWGVMQFGTGGNNRIKFHISDMNGNRAVSSSFTITVNATSSVKPKPAGTITIDGATSDWSLSEFTALSLGGQNQTGDTALVGYNGGTCYYGAYAGVLPTSASDHTAKVYSREDGSYVYFLVRCDDNDMRYSYGSSMNWANDCAEFYIDPSHNGGSTPISSSTSDVQLVIDCNNQKNVYECTSGYASQVLGGVTSAVVRDGTGWWGEVRIQKSVLDPDLPALGVFGLEFNFRDNDNNNDAGLTTVYDWRDWGAGFPSKIPDHWGHCLLP